MSEREELSAIYAHADRIDDRYMKAIAERDALAAELAEAKAFLVDEKAVRRNAEEQMASAYDTLDYFGHSPPYDGSQAKANQERIRALEAALTKFLIWNGTDYVDDESREYALVGICEDAYKLIPASALETKPEFDPAWVCGVCGKRHGQGECLGVETP